MRCLSLESFGETCGEEKQVVLLRLSNSHGMRVQLLNYGATIRSIVVLDREGREVDVVCGFDSLREYEECSVACGGTVGRVAGRIRMGQFALNSKHYLLATNAGAHHHDGGARHPLHKKVWDYSLLEEGNGVIFTVRSHDGEEGYPGNITASVSYVLTEDNELLVQHSASTDTTTPINLATQVYFNLDGQASTSLESHEISLSTTNRLVRDDEGIVTGEIVSSASRFPVRLSARNVCSLSAIHCSLPMHKSAKRFRHVARVTSLETGIELNVTTSQACVELEPAMRLEGIAGKDGRIMRRHSAFALICKGFEDSVNQKSFASFVVRPDQHYQHITIYRFSTKQ